MITVVKKSRFISMPAIIAYAGFLIMLIVIAYAFICGDFFEEGSVLFNMAWGMVTLVDLYLGLLLFSFWIVCREKDKGVAFVWTILVLLLGNMFSCLYILKAAYGAESNMIKFWLGDRVESK